MPAYFFESLCGYNPKDWCQMTGRHEMNADSYSWPGLSVTTVFYLSLSLFLFMALNPQNKRKRRKVLMVQGQNKEKEEKGGAIAIGLACVHTKIREIRGQSNRYCSQRLFSYNMWAQAGLISVSLPAWSAHNVVGTVFYLSLSSHAYGHSINAWFFNHFSGRNCVWVRRKVTASQLTDQSLTTTE